MAGALMPIMVCMIVSTLQKQSADRLVMAETCESGARVGMLVRTHEAVRPGGIR